MIEVRLFATFREGREKVQFLDAQKYYDGLKILEYLNISPSEVAIFLINGRHSKVTSRVENGDILAIFPPVGGG